MEATRFNPRRPRGRRPQRSTNERQGHPVSIHAARAGGDVVHLRHFVGTVFQSTPPARAATPSTSSGFRPCPKFQSTPPARAATLASNIRFRPVDVSIHAARAGGDGRTRSYRPRRSGFQSTPPARAATAPAVSSSICPRCFNPRRPRGRRLEHRSHSYHNPRVSIHAARAGGDLSQPIGSRSST